MQACVDKPRKYLILENSKDYQRCIYEMVKMRLMGWTLELEVD